MATLAKSFSTDQADFLGTHLGEYQVKVDTAVRGEAKKYALSIGELFLAKYSLPDGESEEAYKEAVFAWFKSKAKRKPRKSSAPKPKVAPVLTTDAAPAPPTTTGGYAQQQQQQQQGNTSSASPASTSQLLPAPMPRAPSTVNLSLNVDSLRDSFLAASVDTHALSATIQTYARTHPSGTPLTAVVTALFNAVTAAESQFIPQYHQQHPHSHNPAHTAFSLLQRYRDACSYFPVTSGGGVIGGVTHAGDSGPGAGHRALLMEVRKHSIWDGFQPALQVIPTPLAPMSDEQRRIQHDRVRRNDHLRWARIHAIAMELGMLDAGRALSQMMVRDCVWQPDEVEWDAGVVVLRAVIRTSVPGDVRQNNEYASLLNLYEGRWRDIKDENRQTMVTQVIMGAKEDLARLNYSPPPAPPMQIPHQHQQQHPPQHQPQHHVQQPHQPLHQQNQQQPSSSHSSHHSVNGSGS